MYADVARFPRGAFHFPTGRPIMERLGYAPELLDALPPRALESFAGVGHHFDVEPLRPGEHVLDLGCGAGSDVFAAAAQVGSEGRAVGIDMTESMLDKARAIAEGRVRMYVELIQQQSTRLIDVVNWLLQAIRIAAEPRSLDAAPTEVDAVLRDVVAGLAPLAEARGVAVELRAAPTISCVDGAKLHQLVENLVANAVKFTDEGGRVSVTLEAGEDAIVIGVADTGIGMDEEALSKIFHRYYRAHPEREGSGLGLLIARELVRLHGGELTVESAMGRGSVFTVSLPSRLDGVSPARRSA